MAEASLKLGGSWATKEGSLLGFNDQNGNYKPIPFDFTRATTATRVNRNGLIEEVQSGVPRIDFTGDGSLLLEPQRTNSVFYSENLSTSSGYWGNIRCSVTINNIISPEGIQNGVKLLQDNTTTTAGLINLSITASGTNTFSFYAKAGSTNFVRLSIYSTVETSVYFDLVNGTIGTTNLISESNCFITDMGNGWYRCGATYSGTTNRFNIYIADRDGETNLLDASNAYIYVYGAQWEQSASYATSYIKTSGSAVTRNADACENTSASSYIGQTEGTILLDFIYNGKSNNTADNFNLTIGTFASNVITIGQYNAALYGRIYSSSVIQFSKDFGNITEGTRYKCAIAYNSNDAVFYVNGSLIGSDTTVIVPATSTINLNRSSYENSKNINQVLLYKTRLTNTELAELTTI